MIDSPNPDISDTNPRTAASGTPRAVYRVPPVHDSTVHYPTSMQFPGSPPNVLEAAGQAITS